MPRAAEGNDVDAVGLFHVLVDDEVILANLDLIGEGKRHTLEQFFGERLGIVDKFLHCHFTFPPI